MQVTISFCSKCFIRFEINILVFDNNYSRDFIDYGYIKEL